MNFRSRFLDGTFLSSRISKSRGLIKSIQRGTIALINGVTTNNATITAVNTSNSLLHFLGNAESDSGSGSGFAILEFTSSTTITATRQFNVNTNTISFEVVEYFPGIIKSIQRAQIAVSTTSNTATVTAVNLVKSNLEFLGSMTNDNVSGNSRNWTIALALTNATTITATSSVNGGNTVYTVYQLVEWY